MLDSLIDFNTWLIFLESKENKLSKKEFDDLSSFIKNREYMRICLEIKKETYNFSIPKKSLINKNGVKKKRVVYSFSREENYVLKMVQFLLQRYDYLLGNNCYSFRKNIGPKDAFYSVLPKFSGYGYKVDISNYFNSINIDILLSMLENSVDDKTYRFFEKLLRDDRVVEKGVIIHEKKGVMAGTPISCFLSNLYLSELDHMMSDKKYARYADDIIIFANTKEELNGYITTINEFFEKLDLTVNHDKEKYYNPRDKIEFLGFEYYDKTIDLSRHAIKKMKKKIRRKARALRRWAIRKNLPLECAMKSLNNIFNYKFFYEKKGKILNWSIWYFPVINTTNGLWEIDQYFQDSLRYIKTGKYRQSNKWKVSYDELKKTGYRSLVHEYYKFKKKEK